jgi:hypothetical protein
MVSGMPSAKRTELKMTTVISNGLGKDLPARGSPVHLSLLIRRDFPSPISRPVSLGIPFPKGMLCSTDALTLSDARGCVVPLQTAPLARWSDGSIKWVLLDFLLNPEHESPLDLVSGHMPGNLLQCRSQEEVVVKETPQEVIVQTGAALFHLDRRSLRPFGRVSIGDQNVLDLGNSRAILTDPQDRESLGTVERVSLEAVGPIRATVKLEGKFSGSVPARFVARLCFFAGTGLVRLGLTLHNPDRAHHPGGLWDLGDPGSILFRDLSLELALGGAGILRTSWTAEPGQEPRCVEGEALEIYQDSSGGTNWKSRNHVNRHGHVPCSFQGYRVRAGGQETHGQRANPVLSLEGNGWAVDLAVPEFWQQFPKALEVEGRTLRVRLFPRQFGDLFELQGGEQKTHVVWLRFAAPAQPPLSWVHQPLAVHAPPEWYAASGTLPYLLPANEDPDPRLQELLAGVVEGSNSFFARREVIDEYGWRNYGELYADHEAAYYKGPMPIISHYNNQYDPVYGTLLQFFRTGETRWLDLHDALARHVIDIDIYHTDRDRAAYNGGLFWHTDHYRDAATSSHRSYSRANAATDPRSYGGGPGSAHNYTTGLLHYYYRTGDRAAREAVLSLANWVINMDDGKQHILGWLDDGPTGLASSNVEADFSGPGRGVGNSVNALLDGWLLTRERRFLEKAEELIRRVVHPNDEVAARDFLNAELRWSYTIFLTALLRYLDLKAEAGDLGFMYAYAQASLLRYAAWMAEHERPYFDQEKKLEYPTETWAAQEFRKANVMRLAAAHADEPLRTKLLERGHALAERAWADLLRFESRMATRPLALVMIEGAKDSYLRAHVSKPAPRPPAMHDFGQPQPFVCQKLRVRARLKTARGLLTTFFRLVNPYYWGMLRLLPR